MKSNSNARKVAFNLFVENGYSKGEDYFSTLMGVTDPPVKNKEPTVQEKMSEAMAAKYRNRRGRLKELDTEILSRAERAEDPYRNYLWDLSVGILAIVFGMRYLIYATLWSLKQIKT